VEAVLLGKTARNQKQTESKKPYEVAHISSFATSKIVPTEGSDERPTILGQTSGFLAE
jgi:hypothetical protein